MIPPLNKLTTPLAVLRDTNVDTDVIYPARFLLITEREGLGAYAFRDRRFDEAGREIADFPLNRTEWRDAQALVVGDGFGTGSSREQAVWALVDYGIRVVIGTGFGDIFAGNASKTGLLLVRVDADLCSLLADHAEAGATLSLNVAASRLEVRVHPSATVLVPLELSAEEREALLNGWEEIDRMINSESEPVADFETVQKSRHPWLWGRG